MRSARAAFSGVAGALSALAAGCSSGPIIVQIPFTERDHAAIVVIEQDTRFEAIAVDEATRNMTPVLRSIAGFGENDPPIRVTALLFEETLAALQIAPGLIVPPDEGAPSRSLPRHRDAEETIIEGDSTSGWRPIESLRREISDLKLPGSTKCREMTPQRFDLGSEQFYAGLYKLDEQSAVVIVYDGSFDEPTLYRVTLDGPTRLASTIAGFTARRGVQANDQRIWLGGGTTALFESTIVRGTLSGGFESIPPRTGPSSYSWIRALAVPADNVADDADIYTLSEAGTIDRFAGGAWTELGGIENRNFGEGGALVWMGPNDLLAASLDKKDLFRIREGVITRETTPFAEDLRAGQDAIVTLASIPGIGVFAGFATGFILRKDGDSWTIFQEPLIAQHLISRIIPYRDGMLIGGDTGALQQWYPNEGFCDVLFIGNDTNVLDAVPIEGGVIVAGVQTLSSTSQRIYVAGIREASRN